MVTAPNFQPTENPDRLISFFRYNFQLTSNIDLDHNNLYFSSTNKTFAWKSDGGVIDCDFYQLSSQYGCSDSVCLCSSQQIHLWPLSNETSTSVGEYDLFDDTGELVAFNIDAYDSISDHRECMNKILEARFLINESG